MRRTACKSRALSFGNLVNFSLKVSMDLLPARGIEIMPETKSGSAKIEIFTQRSRGDIRSHPY